MRGIDDDHIDAGLDQRAHALVGIATDADRGADTQALVLVFGRIRIVVRLLDVLDRDQAAQLERVVDDKHFLDAVPVQELQHLILARAFLHRNEALLARHDVLYRIFRLLLETQIAAGNDTDELLAVDDRHAGNILRAHERHDFADRCRRPDRDRVANHAGFELLDQPYFGRLLFDRHALVDDADAAALRHRDREACLRHGVHRGGKDRNIQVNVARQTRAEADVARQHVGVSGDKRDVVERQSFGQDAHGGKT